VYYYHGSEAYGFFAQRGLRLELSTSRSEQHSFEESAHEWWTLRLMRIDSNSRTAWTRDRRSVIEQGVSKSVVAAATNKEIGTLCLSTIGSDRLCGDWDRQ